MSTDDDIRREEATADEWWDEWREAYLAALSAVHQPPWNDAGPENEKIGTEEE